MPVPSSMSDLSTLATSNSPVGSDPVGNTLDDYLRAHAAIIRSTNALAASSIASASTTAIGAASGESVQIAGTTTITSFGTAAPGLRRECRFSGSLQITHSSSIQLPGAQHIQTQPGDVITFRSLGSGQWILTSYVSAQSNLTDFVRLSQNNFLTGQFLSIEHAQPVIALREAAAPVDERIWQITPTGSRLYFRTTSDAGGTIVPFFTISRTGATVDSIAFSAGTVTVNGQNVRDTALFTSGTLPIERGGTGTTDGTARNITGKPGTTKTLSTAAPTGGSDGDIWFRY